MISVINVFKYVFKLEILTAYLCFVLYKIIIMLSDSMLLFQLLCDKIIQYNFCIQMNSRNNLARAFKYKQWKSDNSMSLGN